MAALTELPVLLTRTAGVDPTSVMLPNASTPAPSPNATVVAFSNLVPAIVQCFTIILCGYVAGRSRLVCSSQAKGLGVYVTYFALPAMIIKSLVELDFSEVNWLFWVSVLLAKSIVYIVVYIGALIVSRSETLGKAGMYSVFATQSNDFALGYPIVKAMYSVNNPELIQYIYLFAPINLLFLNPWSFLSLEVQKNSSSEMRRSKMLVAWMVLKGLITNPVFMSVLVGIILNFALSQTIPPVIDDILTTLADSFGATALFVLGLNMVGKVKQQSGMALLPPSLLIAFKLLVLPLVTNQIIYAFNPGGSNTTLTDTYASFGFLYGSIPTAPTVFLYASYYHQSVDMIAPSMVYCTFISGPFMFITATMLMIPMATEGQYHNALSSGAFDVSCIGLASAVWVFIIFALRKKISHLPHQFTANLVVAQALGALSVILCHSIEFSSYWPKLFHFLFLLVGVFGARCWTAMVALALFILRYRSTCFVVRHRGWFYLYGWGVPVFVTGILIAVMPIDEDVDVLFYIEKKQCIAGTIILFLNLIITIGSLLAQHQLDRFHRPGYQQLPGLDSSDSEDETKTIVDMKKTNSMQDENAQRNHSDSGVSASSSSSSSSASPSSSSSSLTTIIRPIIPDIEDMPALNASIQQQMCGARFGCSRSQAHRCRRLLLRRNLRDLESREEEDVVVLDESKRHQLGRHLILLYVLVLSMVVGVSLSLWQLLGTSQSGIFLELAFLDTILNYGQGFIALAIFGFDTENVIMPVIRFVRKCIYGTEKVRLPRPDELSPQVLLTCEQFRTHHLTRCQNAIVADLKYHLRTYKKVFRGSDLVDWLIEVGMAEGRSEATDYATRLLLGRILEHSHQEHHFHDNSLFYRFIVEEDGGEGGER